MQSSNACLLRCTLFFLLHSVYIGAGGGHAFIGLHLANQLLDAGHTVTLLNGGDQVLVEHAWSKPSLAMQGSLYRLLVALWHIQNR